LLLDQKISKKIKRKEEIEEGKEIQGCLFEKHGPDPRSLSRKKAPRRRLTRNK